MTNRKKIDFVADINKQISNQIKNSQLIRYSKTAVFIAGGLIALGLAFKLINFTVGNFKNLTNTIKTN